ncbi:thiol reductant ABC exporter subunit CydC [Modestobacter sp. I12A-02628]|uniref:Thiol reductant ABC exporter subunit CydC n=1 Tax=Goekera deserti TaxID=2497753 RepID=A0A7K3WIG6_9ACTN|nr:thiol reductant ABC exporter subunit CydC [Goekera deserti]MPQ96689.1 thiol reductant ABC exporter subunit CydC [Goekera deserti]NDI46997.1 thiol reductant ABC exporter subunit CydC [Goekera deserti]NEL56234.1 thiol reductant ABC exporter subunit CydC [Goekera deserti]
MTREPRGPLAPLAGVPGLTGTLVRAGLVALAQTAGLVLLAAGLAHAVARVAGAADGSPVTPLVLATVGAAVRAGAGAAGELLAARDARRAEGRLRRALLVRLTTSPTAVRTAGGPGSAAVLATTRLQDLSPALATYLPALAQTLVVPPVLLVVLAATDLLSAVLVAVTLPLVPVFMALVGLYTRDQTTAAARALDRIAAHVAELVRGLPVLTGLGRAADQVAALRELGDASRTRTLATLRLAFLSALVLELIATLSVALVAVTVGVRLVHGDMALAAGLTALLLAPEAFAPLRALGSAFHAGEAAALAATEARAVLAAPPPTPTPTPTPTHRTFSGSSPASSLSRQTPSGSVETLSGSSHAVSTAPGSGQASSGVVVRGLTVSFPGRGRPALAGADLEVRPGELVALRGRSGSGKSTLLAALAGTLDPDSRVEGTLTRPDAVAVVPQHPRTTADTVADELRRHAAPTPGMDAVVAETLVIEALALVGATALAGRACRTLSPGELQRVALARALVRLRRGATLLLLDEPTAHLDDDATATVAGVLRGLRGRVPVLLVTHDPVLAALADRTVTLPTPAFCTESPAAVSPRPAFCTESAGTPTPHPAFGTESAGTPTPHPAFCTESVDGGGLGWPRRALVRAALAGTASAGAGVALTAVSGWLVVRASEGPQILTLMTAIVGVRLFGMGRAMLRWLERVTAHDAALQLAATTRVRVWAALARQGIAAERTPGHALARVVGDVGLLQDLSVRVLTPPLVAGAVVTLAAGALALVDPVAAGVLLLVIVVAVLLLVLLHRRFDAGAAREEAGLQVAALQQTSALLDGLADLRAHGVAAGAVADLDALAARRDASAVRSARVAALSTLVIGLATGLAAVLALAVGWSGVRSGAISAPTAAALALTPLALAEPLAGLAAALQRRGALQDARARLEAVLTAPVPADPADPLALPRPVRELSTEGLVAGWPGGPDVLRGVDLRAAAGTSWLVVRGPSGTGKSTLLAVLLAALRPRAGRYAVAGIPADTVSGDELRSAVAWLPQEAHVFASSIRANLALAAPRGRLTGADGEARMHRALAAAGLGELVAGLPQGLDTTVGSGGTALSGGERRRLAVARALLADRDVVLLDEPTAHLDGPTAAALVRDLRVALAGRTVVCVTHDPLEEPGDTVLRLGAAEHAHAG